MGTHEYLVLFLISTEINNNNNNNNNNNKYMIELNME